jgi:hypothetical protein
MSQYFAQVNEDNVVVHVSVVTADFMEANPDRYPGRWIETFFDTPGKTYAGVGFIYDEASNDFTPPPAPPAPEPLDPDA